MTNIEKTRSAPPSDRLGIKKAMWGFVTFSTTQFGSKISFDQVMSNNDPKISVVIPAYNRADVLPRAIKSVLNQTYEYFEIIVVDDGSTDNTEEVVKSYDNQRIRYYRFETNQGANAARNKGIKVANSDYISFLDSDDEYPTTNLAEKMKILPNMPSEYGGVYTPQKTFRNGVLLEYNTNVKDIIDYELIRRHNAIGGLSCTAFRRDVLLEVGLFDESLPAAQDYDIYVRVLEGYLMQCVPNTYVIRYPSRKRIGNSYQRKKEAFQQLEAKYNDLLSNVRISNQYFTLGRLATREDLIKDSLWFYFLSLKNNPRNFKVYLFIPFGLFGVDPSSKLKKIHRWLDS